MSPREAQLQLPELAPELALLCGRNIMTRRNFAGRLLRVRPPNANEPKILHDNTRLFRALR